MLADRSAVTRGRVCAPLLAAAALLVLALAARASPCVLDAAPPPGSPAHPLRARPPRCFVDRVCAVRLRCAASVRADVSRLIIRAPEAHQARAYALLDDTFDDEAGVRGAPTMRTRIRRCSAGDAVSCIDIAFVPRALGVFVFDVAGADDARDDALALPASPPPVMRGLATLPHTPRGLAALVVVELGACVHATDLARAMDLARVLSPALAHGHKPLVVMMQPIATYGIAVRDATDVQRSLPVFRCFLDSVLSTVDTALFRYRVLWGFDAGDPVLDVPALRRAFLVGAVARVRARGLTRASFSLGALRLAGQRGATTPFWNALSARALREGADYVMTTNDDMLWHTPHWTLSFAAALEAHEPPRLGVVGPLSVDVVNSGYFAAYPLMTYNFVHRTHLDVFDGRYYPLPFPNGYVDPWLQDVYKAFSASTLLADVQVTNTLTQSTVQRSARYQYREPPGEQYVAEVDAGRQRIAAYLRERGAGGEMAPCAFCECACDMLYCDQRRG